MFWGFTVACLVAAVVLGSGFLGLAVLLVMVTSVCLTASLTLSKLGLRAGVVALTTRPPIDVAPLRSQVLLPGSRPVPLSFPGRKVLCGGALLPSVGFQLCRSRLFLFVIHVVPVVRSVITTVATALWLSSWIGTVTGDVRSATDDAQCCVSALRLLGAKTADSARTAEGLLAQHTNLPLLLDRRSR